MWHIEQVLVYSVRLSGRNEDLNYRRFDGENFASKV